MTLDPGFSEKPLRITRKHRALHAGTFLCNQEGGADPRNYSHPEGIVWVPPHLVATHSTSNGMVGRKPWPTPAPTRLVGTLGVTWSSGGGPGV